ncbi:MAG: BT4734/BF3469 family protein [Verrucomicrobiia bacterium]
MKSASTLEVPVSFGTNIRRKTQLETIPIGYFLDGVQRGRWRSQVELVRQLPAREQQAAKVALPFVIPAGEFTQRKDNGLVRHSGLVVVDVDHLTQAHRSKLMHAALDDDHCFAAFKSPRGEGVKLLFRINPVSAEIHPVAFKQVAEHVRSRYGVEPDRSGSNVSRACFVTWDSKMFLNPGAEIIPIEITVQEPSPASAPLVGPPSVVTVEGPARPLSKAEISSLRHLGQHAAPCRQRPDAASALTHNPSLFPLARSLATEFAKGRYRGVYPEQALDEVFGGWLEHVSRRGHVLLKSPKDYRRELTLGFRSVMKSDGLRAASERWIQWKSHPDFPHDGSPQEKLLFAIRAHCKAEGKQGFFLSCRDAGDICGRSFKTGSKLLSALREQGILKLATVVSGKREYARLRGTRQAFDYVLLEPW